MGGAWSAYGGLADAVFAADVGNLRAGIGLLENRHDLALGESAFLHRLGVVVRPEPSTFDLFLNRGRLHVHLRSVRHLADGSRSEENRYWLTSLAPEAARLLELARGHWSIENQCHRVMDVVYGEDASRARSGHAARNLSLLRRLGHNLLRHDTTVRDSIAGKRKRACLSTSTLEIFLKLREPK
jgi:predicted transposase YbfD/YdcC